MTLLNFESFFRPEKIAKAKEKYFKGQVIELKKVPKVWIGTIKTGLYKVQIELKGIHIISAKCPCDSRSWSRYCEHKLAVLFALREQLDLYPALTASSKKILPSDTELQEQVAITDNPEWEPEKEQEKEHVLLFISTANKILKKARENILAGDCKTAIGDCIEVIKRTKAMDVLLSHNDEEAEPLFNQSFELLAEAIEKTNDEELLEHIAHDLRIEVLGNFRSNDYLFEKYMELLRPISNQGNRYEKFNKVINTLKRIEKFYPV